MKVRAPSAGAAAGGVSDAAAAEAAGAAAPHADRGAQLQPQLPHGGPVARPAVLGLAAAGRTGRRPVPAGELAPQTIGESAEVRKVRAAVQVLIWAD